MSKVISLKQNYEFRRLYKKGNSCVKPSVVVYSGKGVGQAVRLGITVSKKLGGAVCRNRAKRRIRALFSSYINDIKPGTDICVVARHKVLTEDYKKLNDDFYQALLKLGLLSE